MQAQNLTTRASDYGKQIEYWNGVDVSVNARPANGLLLFGGVSTGKTTSDSCEVAAQVPESLGIRPLEYCRTRAPSSRKSS